MGSDRARISHDPRRHWRAVIGQQGRVTVEADANEATAIAVDRERAELVDVVGPAGTPVGAPGAAGAYDVTPVKASSGSFTGDLTLSAGTFYAGGERVVLDADMTYGNQSDWLDATDDPLWTSVGIPGGTAGDGQPASNEIVYLLLRQQEVGAVEDPALRDVALGGPDTSARTRIVQRIVRQVTDQPNETATPLTDPNLVGTWAALGLAIDPATLRLTSSAQLQVSGAYRGAENQLIRVQVASVDGTGVPTLVWGYDNAHHLYQITAEAAAGATTATTFTLGTPPVDVYHQPAAGQPVEILASAAALAPGDTSGYIAATTGIVTTLTSTGGYQPDTQQVVVSTPVAVPAAEAPPLFMRAWDGTAVASGGPVALGDTGLQVTLTLAGGAGAAYHVGDHWLFAVRPGTSAPIYPARILQSPQPPDGPSMWACPLAFIAWSETGPEVTDLRPRFDTLVDTLALITSTELQGQNFPLALLRLFGRGVINGCIPSITVTPPTTGATAVQVTVSVTGGALIDGRGAVVSHNGLSTSQSVPLTFSGPGQLADTKQWLYIVTDATETPTLDLRTTPPVGNLTVPADVAGAITNPASAAVVPPNLACSQSEAAAWQVYGDIPAPEPSGDPAVCLGVIGVQGSAGWTAPDDRQQVFPTPAITSAVWAAGRQNVYAALQAACTSGAVSLQQISLGGSDLNGQALLGGTSGRTATIVLSGPVRGSAVTVNFQSSVGVAVHGPIAIMPGSSSGTVTFDVSAGAGAQSITAVIDGGELQASFTAVHVVAPTLSGGAAAVMSGDSIGVTVALSSPATEAIDVQLTAPNVTVTPATLHIPAGTGSVNGALTVTPPASGTIQLGGSTTAPGGIAGTAAPALSFTAVSLSGLAVTPASITLPTPATGTVSLSQATPYAIQITISVANTGVLTASPTLITVPQGAATVPTFQLTGVIVGSTTVTVARTVVGQSGQVAQQLQTTVSVASKPKETKEGKDTKETKDGKETKDTKERKDVKDGVEKVTGLEKVTAAEKVLDTPSLADEAPREEPVETEDPEGQAFIGPSLRPELGRSAFDPPADETEKT